LLQQHLLVLRLRLPLSSSTFFFLTGLLPKMSYIILLIPSMAYLKERAHLCSDSGL
jgi:hypothetical protein